MYPLNKIFSEALNFPSLSNIYISSKSLHAHLVQPNMPTQTEARRHDKVLLAAFIASLIVSIIVILLTLVITNSCDTNQSTTDTIHSNGTANTTPPTPMSNESATQAVPRSESPNR